MVNIQEHDSECLDSMKCRIDLDQLRKLLASQEFVIFF